MGIYYHVVTDWDGGDIESLYAQYGDDAYDMYLDKWPESDNLWHYHAHVVHLYESLDDALSHAAAFGGQVLEIDGDDLEIYIDDLESSLPHPVCKHEIPASAIRVLD